MALANPRHDDDRQPVAVARIDPIERRRVVILSAFILVLTLAPIAVAALRIPPDSVFSGYVVIPVDAFAYQALWRAGWQGAWLFHPVYTTEPLPAVLLYPWYLWTGHILGGIPGPILYHLSRIGAGAALLGATYRLAAEVFQSQRVRWLAFLLAVFGGGIGPLLGPKLQLGPLVLQPTEMNVSGTSVSELLGMAPHLPWSAALLCWIYVAALRWSRINSTKERNPAGFSYEGKQPCRFLPFVAAVSRAEPPPSASAKPPLHPFFRRKEGLRYFVSGLAAWVGLELIYPQLAFLAVGTILLWGALIRRRAITFALVGAASLMPYLGYLAAVWFKSGSALSAVRLSLDAGDPFSFIVLSHLVAAALIVVALVRRRIHGDLWLPALWLVVMTGFMFLPGAKVVLGRSFIASSIPFGLLATAGLISLLRGVRQTYWRRRLLVLTLAGSSLFGVYSLAQPLWIAEWRLDAKAEYEQAGESELLTWIAPRTTAKDIILSAYLEGIFIPAQTNARAFVGHPDQTIDVATKASHAVAFFDTWSADERLQFLTSTGIEYVLTTDAARSERLAEDPSLNLLLRSRGAALFEVRR